MVVPGGGARREITLGLLPTLRRIPRPQRDDPGRPDRRTHARLQEQALRRAAYMSWAT